MRGQAAHRKNSMNIDVGRRPIVTALPSGRLLHATFFPCLQQLLVSDGLAFWLLVSEFLPRGILVRQPLVRITLLVQLRWAVLHASALQTAQHVVHFVCQVVHRCLRGFFTSHSSCNVLPPELRQLRIIRHVGTRRCPSHSRRAAVSPMPRSPLRRIEKTGMRIPVSRIPACCTRQDDHREALRKLRIRASGSNSTNLLCRKVRDHGSDKFLHFF